MIKPGQKLKEGDFFMPESIEQVYEILNIEKTTYSDSFPECCLIEGMFFNTMFQSINALPTIKTNTQTKHNFADFKQLCENTFKNH